MIHIYIYKYILEVQRYSEMERQLDLWTTDSTKITTFNTFPHDPSARRLLEMTHFDFETQYTLKIPKPQDLVKFNKI